MKHRPNIFLIISGVAGKKNLSPTHHGVINVNSIAVCAMAFNGSAILPFEGDNGSEVWSSPFQNVNIFKKIEGGKTTSNISVKLNPECIMFLKSENCTVARVECVHKGLYLISFTFISILLEC